MYNVFLVKSSNEIFMWEKKSSLIYFVIIFIDLNKLLFGNY